MNGRSELAQPLRLKVILLSSNFVALASVASCGVISFSSSMRLITSLRRWMPGTGWVTGLVATGLRTSPASMAACGSVRSAALTPK